MARAILALPKLRAGRVRRLVALIADNAGTETTDLVIPYGILKESGVADVVIVSTRPGLVKLIPALQIEADMKMAEYDEADASADMIIVPAIKDQKNPVVLAWLRKQVEKGASIGTICDGAWVAARAGVLDNKAATTHWFSFGKMVRAFPKTRWLRSRRYVIDGSILSTAGVSASIPASIALVEAIADHAAAEAVAGRLGVEEWGTVHDDSGFRLTVPRVLRLVANSVAFWSHETDEIPIEQGFQEMKLALVADAWSRTYCSQAMATSESSAPTRLCHGLVLIPDGKSKPGRLILKPQTLVGRVLDETLLEISTRYGGMTADIVALQLEYPVKK